LPRQVARNWNREDVIRIHFGPVLDLEDQLRKPDRLRTHKEIAEFVMEKIAELGEQDRAMKAHPQIAQITQIEHVGSDR
jgi:hypothetical protein